MSWDTIFKDQGKVFHKPHEDMAKVISLFKKEGVKSILDLGCGTGRHIVALAQNGFEVSGMDNSNSGLKQASSWLSELNLSAKCLKDSSCYKKFPFEDKTFDAVISTQVIHHAKLEEILICIKEIERVIKPGGLIFVTVTKNRKGRASKIKEIAPRTYVMLDGDEIGVPHYIFTKALLKKYFNRFKILDLHTDSGNHYCLLARSNKS